MNNFKTINCIEDAVEAIKHFYKIYNIDAEMDANDIYSEFINLGDYHEYLDPLPYNKQTKPIFEYILCFSLNDLEEKYMKMVLDDSIDVETMFNEIKNDYNIENDCLDFPDKKTKITLYDSVIFRRFTNWYGVDKGFKKIDLKQKYEEYKLHWLLEHGYTLTDLISRLDSLQKEFPEATINELFQNWEYENGFDSMIWACYDEWIDNEAVELGLV